MNEVPTWQLIINIAAIIISPLMATWVALYISKKNEIKNEKLKILRILMMTRMYRACLDYANALNLIDVVFYDSKNVRKAYKELLESYRRGNMSDVEFNTKNLKLIEAIIEDVGYSKDINWDEISEPYAPNWYFKELEKNEENKKITLLVGEFLNFIIQNQQQTRQNNPQSKQDGNS